MSADGSMILFEGFLQKRKDHMKMKWAAYWFRLQNTTLFFYTKKNGGALHLRGNYDIYTVQSVREVHRTDDKRFMFEIVMNSGKRKVLAAETATLRQEWVGYLWQAMHLSTAWVSDNRSTYHDVGRHRKRTNSDASSCSHDDRVMDQLPSPNVSASTGHIHQEIRSSASPRYLPENPTHQNALPACDCQHHNAWSINSAEKQEGDYDVLPSRKNVREVKTEIDNVYDVPLSYRKAAEHAETSESIYDVPSSLLRRIPDYNLVFSSKEQMDDETYWRI